MTRGLSEAERLDWLQLARTHGIGPRSCLELVARHGSAAAALAALPQLAARAGRADGFRAWPRPSAAAELAGLAARGASLIVHGEAAYPRQLAAIGDAPPLLTVEGDPALLSQPAIALIGARNASGNGRSLAHALAKSLAGQGLVVVSGLARGIDTAAHEGALAAGGATVAVIAAGIDIAYPSENGELMARIAATGAVVTERPLAAVPQARHFPRRNRLISGLSLGVVVIEAAPQSGSLITARLAAEQGREVMAVPGSPLDPRHRGTNQLLRDGATLVETADDILQALGLAAARPSQPAAARPPAARSRARPAPVRPPLGPPPAAPPPAATSMPSASDLQSWLCERLGPEPLLVDELVRQCHATGSALQAALLELELAGRLERHPGNRVSLACG